MALRIIYGKSGSGKSEYCFKEIARLIDKENKIYIITPEQFSFTAEQKLMNAINTKSVLNAEVITLSRMAHRVMQEVGGLNKVQLTKSGKAMLIYSILNDNKNKLKFLSKSDENIDISMSAITEFKKHGVLPQDLKNEMQNIDDQYLQTKLNDMYLIYNNFEQKLQDGYIEDTDILTILAQNLENVDFVKNSLIYIDEFSGFTYQEYQVLKEFIKLAKQVTITVCTDSLEPSLNPDTDIFYANKLTVSKILNLLKDEKTETKEIKNSDNLDNNFDSKKMQKLAIKVDTVFLLEETRFKTDELKFIEKNIYKNKSTKYEKNVENVHLFLAKNQYSEIENVAKQITKLVKEKNMRYRDISVITRNIDTYSSLIRAIFAEYDIPFFIDEKRDLNQNIIVQYLLSILEIFTNNFSAESVFNYLKIGFSDIEDDDIFKLENYCTKWGIKYNKWQKDFIYGKNSFSKNNSNSKADENIKNDESISSKENQEVEYLNSLRKQIIEPLNNLKSKFGTVKETTKAIYEFMQEQQIEQKIASKIKNLQEIGQIDLANEYQESYKIILEIFDEMVLVFGNEKLGIQKYTQILKTGLKNSELGKIPGTQDQVVVGDIERSRSHKVDAIFIIGLNDGNFPSINRAEGFFGDKDRELLKQDGLELANGTIENLYEENFNIYKAFTTAEKELYLSYSSSELDGNSLRPSMLVNKIKKLFPNLVEKSDIITKNYEITNKKMTYQELLENISNLHNGSKIENIWYTVYKYYKDQNDWYQKLKQDLQGIDYTNIPQNIDKNIIEKLYGNTLSTSVSRLEKYAGCPFSYYLQYGLRLKEREELKVQNFDTGSFMHETIDEFFKKVNKENINLAELVTYEEKIQKLVDNVVEEKLDMGKKYTFFATPKYKILVKRLKRIVAKALKYIIEGLVYSDFNIQGTEVEFGKNGKYKPIIIQLDDGKRIEITGKIDRIDTAESEDGRYLRIIDYKSSAHNIDLNEVYAGLQIQLLTYMDAVCKEDDLMPAGVLYFSLLEQMIKADKKITEEQIEDELRKNFKMKGLILADVKVIKMQDKNLDYGTSKLIPAGITKSGDISAKTTSGVDKEEFKILQDYIYKTIKEIAKEILKGNINIKPYNKDGKKPCDYCPYKAVCKFDTRMKGNKYNYIGNLSKDDVIRKMEKRS